MIYVISAPSGTGKTTLNRRLVAEHPTIEMAISHTTRQARDGETEGKHYHFIDKSQFMKKVEDQDFIEWAEVHGNLYGTSQSELDRILRKGHAPLLEIDVQGWEKSRHRLQEPCSIFILPPSLESLWKRLESRGSDSLETRWIRLQNANSEISMAHNYDYFIVNNDLELAYQELKSIVLSKVTQDKLVENGKNLCQKLNDEFKNADWIKALRNKLG